MTEDQWPMTNDQWPMTNDQWPMQNSVYVTYRHTWLQEMLRILKSVSENCNCFQSTISKIAVILSQSFPKGYNFLLYADRAHCANRQFWENRVNSKIFSGYFRFEFLILKLIAQTFTNQFFVKRLTQNIQYKILKSLFFCSKCSKCCSKYQIITQLGHQENKLC